jgi:hypothetical protein
MQRLIQAPNLVLATLWVDWLKAEGIGASVQREYLRSAAGELPPDQCMPEVWIDDPLQEAQGAKTFADAQKGSAAAMDLLMW